MFHGEACRTAMAGQTEARVRGRRRRRRLRLATLAGFAVLLTVPAVAFGLTWTSASVDTAAGLPLFGSACPSATECVFVDAAGQETTVNPSSPGSASTTMLDRGTALTSVACPSTTQCTAVDFFGREVTFDPSHSPATITSFAALKPLGVNIALESVACPSASLCVAVGEHNAGVLFNPTSPGGATTAAIGAGQFLGAVSCPTSASSCVAVGEENGNGWEFQFSTSTLALTSTATEIDPGNHLRAVTCITLTECVAGDNASVPQEVYFDSTAGTVTTTAAIDSGAPPTTLISAITCTAPSSCVAIDNHVNEISFNAATGTDTVTTLGGVVASAHQPRLRQRHALRGGRRRGRGDPVHGRTGVRRVDHVGRHERRAARRGLHVDGRMHRRRRRGSRGDLQPGLARRSLAHHDRYGHRQPAHGRRLPLHDAVHGGRLRRR